MPIRIFLGVGFCFIHHAAEHSELPSRFFELPSCPKDFESRLLFTYILAVSRCYLQPKLDTRSSCHNEHKETYSAQTKLFIKVTSRLRGRVLILVGICAKMLLSVLLQIFLPLILLLPEPYFRWRSHQLEFSRLALLRSRQNECQMELEVGSTTY
jgi:hypothetical protein